MEFAIAFVVGVVTFILIQINVTGDENESEMQKLVRIAVGKMIGAAIAASSIFMLLMLIKTYLPLEN